MPGLKSKKCSKKVKKDWRDSDTLMKNFGYNKKEI